MKFILEVLWILWMLLPDQVLSATCTAPVGCAYCREYGYHEDKTLFEASCNYPPLSSIPLTLPSTLGKLHASHNHISNLTKASLSSYPYLKLLNLELNSMKFIENGSFARQAFLKELYLGYNRLQNITAGTMEGLRDLDRLRLTRNSISRLHKGLFRNLHVLTVLEIADNGVSVIEEGAFEGLNNLKTLFFGGNQIKILSASTFGSLPLLGFADLSFGSLEEIRAGSFLELPNLSTLHINDNKIRKIPTREPFKGLRKLAELDMSTNPVRFIPADCFADAIGLQTLNMTNMNISVIHNGTFNGLGSLKKLIMNGNPLVCDCNLRWMRLWLDAAINVTNATGLKFEHASITKCSSPVGLAGKIFHQVKQPEFQCTCSTCQKNAGCLNAGSYQNGSHACKCEADWKGRNCDAVCNVTQRARTCSSVGGLCYCSYPIERNTTIVCHKNAVLLNISNTLLCQCMKGFTGNGSHCVDIDECANASSVCHPKASCKNFQGFHECNCMADYEGDGEECYPALSQPKNIKVTQIKSTSVIIAWFINTTADIKACMLMLKEVGVMSGWTEKEITLNHKNRTVLLGGLKPGTTYLLKLMLISQQNSRSPMSEIAEFKTDDEGERGRVQGAGGSGSSTAVVTSVCVVGVLVCIVVLVVYFVRRERIKAKRRDAMLAVEGDLPLAVIDTVNDNPAYIHSDTIAPPARVLDKWEIPRDQLILGDKLGEGEFGVVLEGQLLIDETPQKVAIKMLKEYADRSDYKDMLRELDMFKGVGQHENVVSLLGACTVGMPLYIITEYVAGGTLLELLRDSRKMEASYVNANLVSKLSAQDLVKLALDVARGMKHISDNRFVHRDLAARNVLVTTEMVAKITDFGLTRDIYTDGIYLNSKGGKLPLKWMAPESILDYVYTSRSDVWSYGVVLWEIWSYGAMPYSAVPPNELLAVLLDGYRLDVPPQCPREIYDVIRSCWNAEPEVRPTFPKLCTILEEVYEETPKALTVHMSHS